MKDLLRRKSAEQASSSAGKMTTPSGNRRDQSKVGRGKHRPQKDPRNTNLKTRREIPRGKLSLTEEVPLIEGPVETHLERSIG